MAELKYISDKTQFITRMGDDNGLFDAKIPRIGEADAGHGVQYDGGASGDGYYAIETYTGTIPTNTPNTTVNNVRARLYLDLGGAPSGNPWWYYQRNKMRRSN